MRIIEYGRIPNTKKIKRCKNCLTLFEYDYNSETTTIQKYDYRNEKYSTPAVKCPFCEKVSEVSSYDRDDI